MGLVHRQKEALGPPDVRKTTANAGLGSPSVAVMNCDWISTVWARNFSEPEVNTKRNK